MRDTIRAPEGRAGSGAHVVRAGGNLRACMGAFMRPTNDRAILNERSPGTLGIPEFMPPDDGGTFKVNLHAPTGECATMNESCSGALGIPEFMPPVGGGTFKVNRESKNRFYGNEDYKNHGQGRAA